MIAFTPSKDRQSTLLAFPVAAVFSSPRRAIASNVFDCWLEPFNRKLSSFAHGVGRYCDNEDPLALVRRTAFSRAKYSPRCLVTHLLQIADDAGESHRDVTLDVLKENNGRPNCFNPSPDVGPEMPLVVATLAEPSMAERLARIPRTKDVHAAAKKMPREIPYISPDRSRIKRPIFHSRK